MAPLERASFPRPEVVFNTAISGYQESLTDPSYTGQILVETFPLIGNTGVNQEDVESQKVQVSGFVVRELTRRHSNYRATDDLSSYLAASGAPGIAGVIPLSPSDSAPPVRSTAYSPTAPTSPMPS